LTIKIDTYLPTTLSIARLSLYSIISSYSTSFDVHGVSGQHYVNVVLIRCLPADAPYILGHVVDRKCDTPVEFFVVHTSNIGQVGLVMKEDMLCS
jgi:hypothetical protein